jgi:cytochrome c-type biogenesis protein CcmF
MPTLGSFALLLALALAAYNFVMGSIAERQIATRRQGRVAPERLAATARLAGLAGFVAVSAAAIALLSGLFTNDFSLAYVLRESNRALPAAYKFAALWSGQEGSLLLWAWLLSGYGFLLRLRRKEDSRLIALASTLLAGIEVFFLLLLNFVALPFAMIMGPSPADGNGMNPLLQYPEMVIHPPMLYLGYVGFSVPFVITFAALLLRTPDKEWIPSMRRWAIVAWLFLTCGIVLGMHWAYAVLGWGGYWGWDPVENASLMPWLTGTAFLHATIMQKKRGMMKKWNVWLIFCTFLLCILGTLLTRSGIVSSVHAFGKSPIGAWFWVFLLSSLVLSVWIIQARRDQLRTEHKIEGILSREASFLFNSLVLLAACIIVFAGTLFPLFSEMVNGEKITVGPPFYNRVIVPIGLFLLLLTGTAPLLGGRGATFKRVRKNFVVPGIAGVVTAVALIAFGVHPWADRGSFYSLLCFSLAAFVIAAISVEVFRGVIFQQQQSGKGFFSSALQYFRSNTRRHGAFVIHFGIVLMFIGFAGSAFNQNIAAEFNPGRSMDLGPYHLVSHGYTQTSNQNYIAERSVIDVYRAGAKRFQLLPEARLYQANQTVETMVANHSTLLRDLYVIYEGRDPDNGTPIVKAILNPLVIWIWIGAALIVPGIGMVLAPTPRRNRLREIESPSRTNDAPAMVSSSFGMAQGDMAPPVRRNRLESRV